MESVPREQEPKIKLAKKKKQTNKQTKIKNKTIYNFTNFTLPPW